MVPSNITQIEIHGRVFDQYGNSNKKNVSSILYRNLTIDTLIDEGWYLVKTNYDKSSDSWDKVIQEILNWLDTIEHYFIYWDYNTFLFSEELDAIAFKLRWM